MLSISSASDRHLIICCIRNVAHPVNAILNYAYTVLESEIRIKTISEGYDRRDGGYRLNPEMAQVCGGDFDLKSG